MKILVFAKQIPDVNQIRFDPETKRIVRENVPLSMNPFDKRAVEEALRIKEKHGGETAVASMGPPQARDVLNEALKMGMDRAYLVTDRKFGGSDTLATARILSSVVSLYRPDLVLMGKYSLDGETSQVPPEVAVFSGYAFKSSVSGIEIEDGGKSIVVEQESETGLEKLRIPLPAVISVSEKINRARSANPDAKDMFDSIVELDSSKLGIQFTGQEFSPTVVTGTEELQSLRTVEMLKFDGDIFRKISEIIGKNRNSGSTPGRISLKKPEGRPETIMGIVMDDPLLGEEISSKIAELGTENRLKVVLFGNVEPGKMKLSCHEYYLYQTDSVEAFEDALEEFVRAKNPTYIIFPSTVKGREVAGTMAARFETGLTADCVDIEIKDSRLIQKKPAFGGGIIASIYSKRNPQMTTVRPGMFEVGESDYMPQVFELVYEPETKYDVVSVEPVPQEYRPLPASSVVVGIGRGLKRRDQVPKALELADLLDASIGSTRPLVDMKFLPRQQQIGITGMSISPGVYLAIGISGMANHVVGIRYSGKVIAVNNDPNAEIFRYSDYGIVADANEFIEGFVGYLKENR